MTFLETLQTHRGGLLRIKSELYWYDGRGWDRTPGRVCLILDAATTAPRAAERLVGPKGPARSRVAALLLIDGAPRWIWVSQEDVEIL